MKKNKLIFIIEIILILFISNMLLSKSFANDKPIFQEAEITEEYKKWLNLSDEEKKNRIIPRKYVVRYEQDNSNNMFKKLRLVKAGLSSNFNLKNKIANNLKIKNQFNTESCWAFSNISSIETNLALRDHKNKIEISNPYNFSERHMEYYTTREFKNGKINEDGYNRKLDEGGNNLIASSYFMNGYGLIQENDMPFKKDNNLIDISEIQNKNVATQVYDTVTFPDYKKSSNQEDVKNIIKEHIQNYGSVSAIIHSGKSLFNNVFYVNKTAAHYCDNINNYPPNHAISIVGWDDNFAKENFNSAMRPKNNGAWIIRNSWGERNEGTIKEAKENVFNRYKDYCVSQGANSASQVTEKILKHFEYVIENGRAYQKIGDNGYMYVSYEDDVVSKDMTGVIKVENEVSYNNMYNYDKYLAANNLTGSFEELFLLNVFDKKNTGKEYLTSVSIYAPTKYTASVYVNPDNEDKNMEKMQLMLLKNGIEETFEAGYHTIVFKNPIELTGNKFAVCIKVKNSNNKIGVALESKIDGYKMLDNVKVENNRCFVGLKNKSNEILWNDLSNGKNLGNINPGDLTIKAYTTNNLEDGSLNKIEIMTPPNKTNYIEGENFDKTGMKIKAYYNTIDHKEVILKDSDYSIMDANNLTYGQENITIQYMDKLLFQPITVDKNSVVKLSIKNPPIKTEYIEGEKFDKTGIIVEAEYKNGAKKEINNYTISNENKLTKDITSVVISYENVTVEQKIVVKERKIEKIEIKKLPNKKMYLQNKEELDLTGGILLIRYNNDTTAEIDLNSSEVKATGFDNTKLGENTINIEYKMLKTNFNVKIVDKHVNPNLLVKIKIKKNPNKIDYFENEKFDDTGMEIVGVYEDLHEELIDSYQIVNGNNLKFNQEKVIIQYKDFYVEVKINVKKIELVKVSLKNKPNKLIYIQDEEQLDLSGGKLLLEYNNGIEKEIDLYNENVEITGFNNKELGNQLIKINYQNHELNFNVEIIEKEVAKNSNFDNSTIKIDNAKMYLFSDKNIEPYLTFNSQISNIKQEENDSFEYYYYLSEKDGENDIKDWVKIDKEIENNKLSFEVNSRELKNFDILGEKESVFMYIKEIAKKGNDQKVLVKQFKIQDKQEMEIYIDNKILESDNNNTEEENKEENKDDTTAPDKIPQTGIITMSFTIIILVILGIIYYIKYKKYNI